MAKRKTMEEDPLDAVVPTKAATKASRRGLAPAGTYQRPEKPPRLVKERLTVHLSVELIERVKNAVYWTPGLTLAGLAEKHLSAAVDKLEKKNGKPFPQRSSNLKGGRPLK